MNRPQSPLLAVHEDLPSDFFEFLEEHTEDFDQCSKLSETQLELAFSPEAQQNGGCVWSYDSESGPYSTFWFSHDVFAFCRYCSPAQPTAGGGGPVKGFLTAGQKLLFAQSWMKRAGGKGESP